MEFESYQLAVGRLISAASRDWGLMQTLAQQQWGSNSKSKKPRQEENQQSSGGEAANKWDNNRNEAKIIEKGNQDADATGSPGTELPAGRIQIPSISDIVCISIVGIITNARNGDTHNIRNRWNLNPTSWQ